MCDVFDALTHERPYKRAWTVDEAVEELVAERGRFFDPDLVDLFVDTGSPRFSPAEWRRPSTTAAQA